MTLFSCHGFCFPGQGTVSCHIMLGHFCGTVRNGECRGAAWEYTGGCGLPPLEVTPHICLQTSSSASIVHYYTECCKPLCEPSDACASAPAQRRGSIVTLCNQRAGWCRRHPCKPQAVVAQVPSSATKPVKELSTPCHHHSLVALRHSLSFRSLCYSCWYQWNNPSWKSF